MLTVTNIAVYGLSCCTAGALGCVALPSAVDAVLKWKRKLIKRAFDSKISRAAKVKAGKLEEMDAAEAASAAKWAEAMVKQEQLGKVEPWMARQLEEVGVIEEARDDSCYLPESDGKWSFKAGFGMKTVLCAAGVFAMGAVCSPIVTMEVTPWIVLPALALLGLVAALLLCDLKTKTFPWQLCAACAVPSAVLTLLTWGWPTSAACAGVALAATAFFWGVSKLTGLFGLQGGVGAGDLRLIPWIAMPLGLNGCLYGLFTCLAVMLAGSIGSLIARKAGFGDYLPMGPGLLAWFVIGSACIAAPALVTVPGLTF